MKTQKFDFDKVKTLTFEEVQRQTRERRSKWWYPTYWQFRYGIPGLIRNIRRFPHEVRWFFQRARRGWANVDTWSFDHYVARVIHDGLVYLKSHQHIYPGRGEADTPEAWGVILDDIIFTFEILSLDDYFVPQQETHEEWTEEWYQKYSPFFERRKEIYKDDPYYRGIKIVTREEFERFKRGWDYFQRYYGSLWD